MWRFLRNCRLILRLHTIFRALIYWAHRTVIFAIVWFSCSSFNKYQKHIFLFLAAGFCPKNLVAARKMMALPNSGRLQPSSSYPYAHIKSLYRIIINFTWKKQLTLITKNCPSAKRSAQHLLCFHQKQNRFQTIYTKRMAMWTIASVGNWQQ